MVMAFCVLLGVGLLAIFAFDGEMQGADQTIEAIVARQAKEMESAQREFSKIEEKLAAAPGLIAVKKELERLKRENSSRDGQIERLQKDVDGASEAVSLMTEGFEAYKKQYRALVRGSAKGQDVGMLKTRDGTVYENVNVRNVSAIGIQIRHSGGMKRIPFENLPAELQEQFQFDPKEKAEALAIEKAARQKHEAEVSTASLASARLAAEREREAAKSSARRSARELAAKKERIKSLRREIAALEKEILHESRQPLSRAPQMKPQLAAKQRELAELQSDVSRLLNSR